LFVGPEFRLLCLDTGTIQLRDPLLPFFNQPGRLAVSSFGTRKDPFGSERCRIALSEQGSLTGD